MYHESLRKIIPSIWITKERYVFFSTRRRARSYPTLGGLDRSNRRNKDSRFEKVNSRPMECWHLSKPEDKLHTSNRWWVRMLALSIINRDWVLALLGIIHSVFVFCPLVRDLSWLPFSYHLFHLFQYVSLPLGGSIILRTLEGGWGVCQMIEVDYT